MSCNQLFINLGLICSKLLGNLGKTCLQFLVFGLSGKSLCPVQCDVEMAAPVIDLADFTRRVPVVIQKLRRSLVKRISKKLSFFIFEGVSQMLQRNSQRQEFTKRIPSQIPFLLELLHMFWCRASCTCLE